MKRYYQENITYAHEYETYYPSLLRINHISEECCVDFEYHVLKFYKDLYEVLYKSENKINMYGISSYVGFPEYIFEKIVTDNFEIYQKNKKEIDKKIVRLLKTWIFVNKKNIERKIAVSALKRL